MNNQDHLDSPIVSDHGDFDDNTDQDILDTPVHNLLIQNDNKQNEYRQKIRDLDDKQKLIQESSFDKSILNKQNKINNPINSHGGVNIDVNDDDSHDDIRFKPLLSNDDGDNEFSVSPNHFDNTLDFDGIINEVNDEFNDPNFSNNGNNINTLVLKLDPLWCQIDNLLNNNISGNSISQPLFKLRFAERQLYQKYIEKLGQNMQNFRNIIESNKDLKSTLNSYQLLINSDEQRINDLRDSNLQLSKENQQLKKKVTSKSKDLDGSKTKPSNQSDIGKENQLREIIKSKDRIINDSNQKYQKLNISFLQITQDNRSLQEKIRNKDRHIKDLENNLNQLSQQLASLLKNPVHNYNENEYSKVIQTNKLLESDNTKLLSNINTITKECNDYKAKNSELKNQFSEIIEMLRDIQTDFKGLQSDYNELDESYKQKEVQYNVLLTKKKKYKSELFKIRNDNQLISDDHKKLQDHCELQRNTIHILERKLDHVGNEMKLLHTEYQNYIETNVQLMNMNPNLYSSNGDRAARVKMKLEKMKTEQLIPPIF